LERRLERLLDGAAGRAFTGQLHPAEIATRIAREADLATFDHASGPATANRYLVTVNPDELGADTNDLRHALEVGFEEHAAEVGLRLEGPASITFTPDPKIRRGGLGCRPEVVPGPMVPWGKLTGPATLLLAPNRVLLGRSAACDAVYAATEVSRIHALIWREGGKVWIRDLHSANGTYLDGAPLADRAVNLEKGARVGLASTEFRYTGA
jgi:hypothetical protein